MASKSTNPRQEMIVGIFTAAAIIGLITMVFVLNKTIILSSNNSYVVTFGFIDGLEPAAPVRYAGLTVGKVESIEMSGDSSARMRVHIRVRDDVPLREDVYAGINTLGMIGEKYVEIVPYGDTLPVLAAGASIRGRNPLMMTEIMQRGEQIVEVLQSTVSGVNTIVSDRDVQAQIRRIVANAGTAVDNANGLMSSLHTVASENRADVRTTVHNVSIASGELPQVLRELRSVAANIDATASAVRTFSTTANGITAENRENLQKILANLETTSRNLKGFSADIEANPWKLLRTP
ncbi:MAG TPA: MlaD family protein [bacterium]|nr:MlaD family protein [bacterium]